ncbi:MAG: pyridine nucleotide-disulfide oxidoreductase [Chloroflexi bacterium]|nr:MAG: pyridine nucleotide-disulfide oxidoreductase [Chloroflexota bacterium]
MVDYDLVVIGAGSAGLTAVDFAVELGGRVALVEKYRIGGDCTWTGCVPSKALLQVGKVIKMAETAVSFGLTPSPTKVDMKQVRTHIQQVIADIYQHETVDVLRGKGIDVFTGAARFVDSHTIQVGEQTITSRNFIVATGAKPFILPISGLETVPYHTYETVFDNEQLPNHLIVLGAGAVGVELAQAYRRLGADVTLIDVQLLPDVDADARAVMHQVLADEEIKFVEGVVTAVHTPTPNKMDVIVNERTISGDMLLVATGRRPNIESLDLEKAGITFSKEGIDTNEKLQTTTKHIFAAGDCTGGFQFTHYAGWQGFQAARNALLPGSAPGMMDTVPWTIFSDPEIAQVGLAEAVARTQFEIVQVTRQSLDRVDRAVTDQSVAGFIKIVHEENGRILGATIVAPRAGEMINEFAIAMQHNLKIRDLAEAMHVYPSYGMGIQRLAAKQATDSFLESSIGKMLKRFV